MQKLNFNSLHLIKISVLGLLVCVSSCTTEKESLGDEITLNSTNAALATPVAGSTYTIRNVKSGLTMDISGASNSNGANLQVWGTNVNTGSTHRQFRIVSTSGDYVRIVGVDSGKSLEIEDGDNGNGANAQQIAYDGGTNQQWEIIPVGDGEFRIKGRDSGKSLRASGTSNGSNVDQWAYRSWESQKWFFTEVGGSDENGGDNNNGGDSGNNGNNNGGGSPGGILGIDNDDWKLNGFSDSPSANADYHDDVMDEVNGNIATWSNSDYFFSNNGFAYFKAYRGMESSSGSGNPRVELRELDNGSNASWNGDNGTHRMAFTVRVDQLPNGWDRGDDEERDSGTVCFGQIHGPSGTNSNGVEVDDTIRVQFDGTRGQTSGNVNLKISGYITEEQGGGSESFSGYRLDTEYDVEIIFSNDRVSVRIDGDEVFGRTMNTAGNGSYFKVGSYIQSVQEGSFDGSFGLVGIKNLSITHP